MTTTVSALAYMLFDCRQSAGGTMPVLYASAITKLTSFGLQG